MQTRLPQENRRGYWTKGRATIIVRATPRPLSYSCIGAPFHQFAELVLHRHRLVFVHHEPPRADEYPGFQVLQLLLARLEAHLDNCVKRSQPSPFQTMCKPPLALCKVWITHREERGLGRSLQESPKSVDFASGLPLKIMPSSGVIPMTPV